VLLKFNHREHRKICALCGSILSPLFSWNFWH